MGDPKTTREVLCGRCLVQHHFVEESWGENGVSLLLAESITCSRTSLNRALDVPGITHELHLSHPHVGLEPPDWPKHVVALDGR